MARQSLKSLLKEVTEQVRCSSVPIKSVVYDPSTKKLRIEFGQTQSAPVDKPHDEQKPRFVPGTDIADDGSMLSPLDIVAAKGVQFD